MFVARNVNNVIMRDNTEITDKLSHTECNINCEKCTHVERGFEKGRTLNSFKVTSNSNRTNFTPD